MKTRASASPRRWRWTRRSPLSPIGPGPERSPSEEEKAKAPEGPKLTVVELIRGRQANDAASSRRMEQREATSRLLVCWTSERAYRGGKFVTCRFEISECDGPSVAFGFWDRG